MDTNSVLSFQASFCVLYKIRCVSYKTGVLKCPHQQVLLYSNNNSTTVQLICSRHCELIHTEDQCSAVAGDIVWIVPSFIPGQKRSPDVCWSNHHDNAK